MNVRYSRVTMVGITSCVVLAVVLISVGWPGHTSFGQEPEWQTYPDTHPWLTYQGDWQTYDVDAASGGTLTGTADPGAILTAHFEGTGIQVIYSTGPEGQTFSVQVDGQKTTAFNYSDQYTYGNVLPLDGFSDGPHTLTVTNGDGAFWIEAVQVQGSLLDPGENETGKPTATPLPDYTPTPARESLHVQPIGPLEAQRLQTITIPVTNVTELINAVASSNGNCGVHTIIEMTQGAYSLTAPTDTTFYGNNGLKVNCTLTVNGNGSTITRNSGTNFRIFGVDSGANLTLNNVTVHNGWATATGGGGILSVFGTVNISQTNIISNTVAVSNGFQILGGGVYSYNGTLTIEESEIRDNSNNSTVGDGGGIGVIAGTANITRSDIRNNSTTRDGGGVAMLYNGGGTVDNSCFVGNNRISLFGNKGANAQNNWWGAAAGPLIDTYSTGIRDSVNNAVTYMPYKDSQPGDCTPGTTLTLADFGIVATGNWNQNELDAMLAAAMLTGQAYQSQYSGGDSPADKFNEVMYLPGRDTIEIVRSTQSGYYCTTDNNNVSGTQQAVITCDANVIVTEYTVVHELGHVLVGRTGGYTQQDPNAGNAATLYALAESGTISDNRGPAYLVFGYYVDSTQTDQWERGNRGWGSSSVRYSDSQACDYQQNPTVEDGRTTHEVDEGIADMFLNWSFDEVNGGIYKNIDWRQATNCVLTYTADSTNPGNARSVWMNDTMATLGSDRGW